MMYRIETTRQAAADRDHCFDYIAERSPDGALRWLEAYEMAVESLLENPLRGFAPENPQHEEEIRQLLFKTRHGLQHRVLYLVREETIYSNSKWKNLCENASHWQAVSYGKLSAMSYEQRTVHGS